jgi:hydroxymethylpyrimidine/phosphomethylpyrimidine kinase
MAKKRPYVASIAGYDPSAGAGLLADTKTFEMHKVYGFGICTAMTWQNDDTVQRVDWYPVNEIIAQLELLLPKFRVDWFKIGIIENADSLREVCTYIKKVNPKARILWDPVLKSSSGYSFFRENAIPEELLELVDWITPNLDEFKVLLVREEKALAFSSRLSIYHKGGHNQEQPGKDWLYHEGKGYPLNPKGQNISPKHGSGCVFSAALCANLALGYPVLKACLNTKRYMEKILSSNPGLLAWHK